MLTQLLWMAGAAVYVAIGATTSSSNTDHRIWFEGDKMPGTNSTITGGSSKGGWQGSGGWQQQQQQGQGNQDLGRYGGGSRVSVTKPTDSSLTFGNSSFGSGSTSNIGSTSNSGTNNNLSGSGSGTNYNKGNGSESTGKYGGSSQGSSNASDRNKGGNGSVPSGSWIASGNKESVNTYGNSGNSKPASTVGQSGSSFSGWGFQTKKPETAGYRPQTQGSSLESVGVQTSKIWEGANLTSAEALLARGIIGFGLQMERALPTNGNKIFSPVSVGAAMALILLGARGWTERQLANALGLSAGVQIEDRMHVLHQELGRLFRKLESGKGHVAGVELTFASGLFVQRDYPVNTKYMSFAKSHYDSDVLQLDFKNSNDKARIVINKWVSDRTDSRITDLIPGNLSPNTRMVIANALYFNGRWEYPFMASLTKTRSFYVSSTETVEVPMMVNTAEVYYFADKNQGYKVLGLPYKGGEMFFFTVVPERDLKSFVGSLNQDSIQDMVKQTALTQVIYTMPRMRLESRLQLRSTLQKMGVTAVFDPSVADLSGIAPGLMVSEVFHKVQIEVTETGTVAAAATGATLTRDGSTPIVRVDKPFLFFIYHKPTEAITFWGTVYRPTPFTPVQLSGRNYYKGE